MDLYENLLKITDDKKVQLASEFKSLINKELVLGQTRYVCRYGTLSDGHEKITDSQRYYQAIKEMYYLAGNFRMNRANAMIAQADLLDAEEELKDVQKLIPLSFSKKLRAESKVIMAKEKLLGIMVQCEDQMRMLDEYTKVYEELKPVVTKKYQNIEEAEEDNWKAVAQYRINLRRLGQYVPMTNIPLEPKLKASLGSSGDAPDMAAWYLTTKNDPVYALSNVKQLLETK